MKALAVRDRNRNYYFGSGYVYGNGYSNNFKDLLNIDICGYGDGYGYGYTHHYYSDMVRGDGYGFFINEGYPYNLLLL